jgi:hypothetical protein
MSDTRASDTPKPKTKPDAVVEKAKAPKFLSVDECRASLPIKISRRMVVNYIRAAGPALYQEHRRQLFVTPEQWLAIVAKMMNPHKHWSTSRVRPSSVLSPEDAYERARAWTRADMPKRPRRVR